MNYDDYRCCVASLGYMYNSSALHALLWLSAVCFQFGLGYLVSLALHLGEFLLLYIW